MKNIINERVLILAFNFKTGESNIDQVRESLREGLYLTDLLFVAPAGYLLTFKGRREPGSNRAKSVVECEPVDPSSVKDSSKLSLNGALQGYSFAARSDEKNALK